jgi:hypothetical protein
MMMMMMKQFSMIERHAAQSTNLSSEETIKGFDAYNALQFAICNAFDCRIGILQHQLQPSCADCETRYEATSVDVFTCCSPPTGKLALVRI